MKSKKLEVKVKIPKGIEVNIDRGVVSVKGPKGEVKKGLLHPKIEMSVKEKEVVMQAKKASKREARMIRTFEAHLKNMIKGAEEGYQYKLKICASHFPVSASVSGSEFLVKNFLGEKIPRRLKLREGVTVKVEGEDVLVEGADKELAGQTAANIERLTKRPGFDKRIFQDGIWLVSKGGKEAK